jgi:hypothetical protein
MVTVRRDVARTLAGDKNIRGLALMKNELYVSRAGQSVIEVYDIKTINYQRNLSIPGLQCADDMTSCPQCDVVYTSDWREMKISVINERGVVVFNWTVDATPMSLSVNPQWNVVVVVNTNDQLQVFTRQGKFIRNITLQSDVKYVWHAIQLEDDRYVIVHGMDSSLQRVCIVNGNGAINQSYGGNKGSDIGQLNEPRRLLVFGGSLIVSDCDNYRVQFLNVSSLTYVRELTSELDTLSKPRRLAISDDGTRFVVSYDGRELRTFNVTWI